MYIFTKLQQHGKDADLKFEQWKEKHSHCARNGYRDKATSSDLMEPTLSTDGGAQEVPANGQVHTSSKKRKSEVPHDEISKSRKVSSESPGSARPVRPAAPI
jgi:hypothetical protein